MLRRIPTFSFQKITVLAAIFLAGQFGKASAEFVPASIRVWSAAAKHAAVGVSLEDLDMRTAAAGNDPIIESATCDNYSTDFPREQSSPFTYAAGLLLIGGPWSPTGSFGATQQTSRSSLRPNGKQIGDCRSNPASRRQIHSGFEHAEAILVLFECRRARLFRPPRSPRFGEPLPS